MMELRFLSSWDFRLDEYSDDSGILIFDRKVTDINPSDSGF
jgi:hypothetical protein